MRSTGGDGAPGWEEGPGWVFGSLQSIKNAQGGFPKVHGRGGTGVGGSAPAAPDVLSSFGVWRASGAHAICRRSQGAPGLISFLDPGAGGEARSGSREQRGRQQMIRSCGHPRSRGRVGNGISSSLNGEAGSGRVDAPRFNYRPPQPPGTPRPPYTAPGAAGVPTGTPVVAASGVRMSCEGSRCVGE